MSKPKTTTPASENPAFWPDTWTDCYNTGDKQPPDLTAHRLAVRVAKLAELVAADPSLRLQALSAVNMAMDGSTDAVALRLAEIARAYFPDFDAPPFRPMAERGYVPFSPLRPH